MRSKRERRRRRRKATHAIDKFRCRRRALSTLGRGRGATTRGGTLRGLRSTGCARSPRETPREIQRTGFSITSTLGYIARYDVTRGTTTRYAAQLDVPRGLTRQVPLVVNLLALHARAREMLTRDRAITEQREIDGNVNGAREKTQIRSVGRQPHRIRFAIGA